MFREGRAGVSRQPTSGASPASLAACRWGGAGGEGPPAPASSKAAWLAVTPRRVSSLEKTNFTL